MAPLPTSSISPSFFTWLSASNHKQTPKTSSLSHLSTNQAPSHLTATMACASAFAPTLAAPAVAQRRLGTGAFAPLVGPVRPVKARAARVVVKASLKEKALTGATAAALAAAMMVPEVAEAAQSGLSPSLKNFLLSIVSGGVVLGVIFGAVIAVANFDPVKRT